MDEVARHQRWRRWLPFVIIVAALLIYYLLVLLKPVSEPQVAKEKRVWVHSIVVNKASQPRNLLLYATVASTQQATISARVKAVVQAILVRDGHRVQHGQLLVKLSDSNLTLALQRSKANLLEMQATLRLQQLSVESEHKNLKQHLAILKIQQRQLKRLEALSGRQFASKESIDHQQSVVNTQELAVESAQRSILTLQQKIKQSEAGLLRVKASLASAENDLSYTKVKAPFNGLITAMHAAKGEHVNVGAALLEIMSTDDLELRALIPTSEVNKLDLLPQQKSVASAQLHGHQYPLRLVRLSGRVKPGQVGREAIFRVLGTHDAFVQGQTVLLKLSLPSAKNSFALPLSALYGNDKVYIIKQGRLQPRRVRIVGRHYVSVNQAKLIVQSDQLHSGDELLTTQIPSAISGLAVKSKTE